MANINTGSTKYLKIAQSVLLLLSILFVFLVSLNMMSGGFKLLGKETAEQIIAVTSNPFIGLFDQRDPSIF